MAEHKEENKSIDSDTTKLLEALNERDLVMMDFKLLGLPYKSIAVEMVKAGFEGVTEDVIKKNFRTDGRLFPLYPKYKVKVLAERLTEGNDLVKAHYLQAIKSLLAKMGKDSAYGVVAAKEVIERAAGKVPNVNFNFDQEELDKESDEWKDSVESAKKRIEGKNE